MTAIPESEPGIFHPDVTVAAIVLRDGRFLMVEESVRGRAVLNQPAGHLEPNESLLQALVRECREETAWAIEPEAFVGSYLWQSPDDGRHFLRFAFAARPLREHSGQALDTGILRALWLSWDELAASATQLRSPLVLAAVDDYLAGQRLPLAAARHVA